MLRFLIVISTCGLLFFKVKPYVIDFYQKWNEGPEIKTVTHFLALPPEPPIMPVHTPIHWKPECGSLLVPVTEFNHVSRGFNLNLDEPHEGIDLAAPLGSDIIAANDGTVAFMGWIDGYGRTVDIDHEDGFMTRYAHLKSFTTGLTVGKNVFLGQPIGLVGMSGHTTGPHLHFELRKNGVPINPITWLGLRSCS
jgi:murein DD-endopeptidase MepM/ murein hydrolase activator NlpD